jgi:uncharacterized membrane protein YqjE
MQQQQTQHADDGDRPLANAHTGELIADLAGEAKRLVAKEVELAKSELREASRREVRSLAILGVAALFMIAALHLIIASAVVALAQTMSFSRAALLLAAATLSVGIVVATVGWAIREKHPLARTEKTLRESLQWTKQKPT